MYDIRELEVWYHKKMKAMMNTEWQLLFQIVKLPFFFVIREKHKE